MFIGLSFDLNFLTFNLKSHNSYGMLLVYWYTITGTHLFEYNPLSADLWDIDVVDMDSSYNIEISSDALDLTEG